LPHQIEHSPVVDVVANQSEQYGMVDAGVVALDIAAEDELIQQQPGADVPHGGLGSAFLAVFARHVVTASREVEPAVQYNRQSLQHQGIEGRPQLNELAFDLESPQRRETILAMKQSVLNLGLSSGQRKRTF
jgi:hypothetical protein